MVLADYRTNSDTINHVVVKMLHRVSVDLKMAPLLYQLSVFTTMQNILHEPTTGRYKVRPLSLPHIFNITPSYHHPLTPSSPHTITPHPSPPHHLSSHHHPLIPPSHTIIPHTITPSAITAHTTPPHTLTTSLPDIIIILSPPHSPIWPSILLLKRHHKPTNQMRSYMTGVRTNLLPSLSLHPSLMPPLSSLPISVPPSLPTESMPSLCMPFVKKRCGEQS